MELFLVPRVWGPDGWAFARALLHAEPLLHHGIAVAALGALQHGLDGGDAQDGAPSVLAVRAVLVYALHRAPLRLPVPQGEPLLNRHFPAGTPQP